MKLITMLVGILYEMVTSYKICHTERQKNAPASKTKQLQLASFHFSLFTIEIYRN